MVEYVSFATSFPPNGQLPTLSFIALILGLGKGGVPGLATIATAATVLTAPPQIIGGLGYAVALMVPILTMIDIYAAYLHRSSLDWSTVWLLLPTSFIGMILGQMLDKHMSDNGARLLVGIILLCILALRTWKDVTIFLFPKWAIQKQLSGDSKEHKESIEGKGSDDEHEKKRKSTHNDEESERLLTNNKNNEFDKKKDHSSHLDIDDGSASSNVPITTPTTTSSRRRKKQLTPTTKFLWACIVGIIGGAATMLTNSMGPILNVYLLSVAELSPSSYVGTRAMFFCFLNLGKLPIRVMGGTLGMQMVPLATGLGLVAVVGVFLAKPIMLGMNEKTFVKLELGVVAFAGLRLCYMGLKQ